MLLGHALTSVGRPLILDGGLATELERRGFVLHERLWSAGILLSRPTAIEDLHFDYLQAGADVIVTSSYQMAFSNLKREGVNEEEAKALFDLSVTLARRAVGRFLREQRSQGVEPDFVPLVGASLGPYGATLCDGSEYRGRYGLSQAQLADFHRSRFNTLVACKPDFIAIETIPSFDEVQALASLLEGVHGFGIDAWLSLSCRHDGRLADGTPLREVGEFLDGVAGVAALGLNCMHPRSVNGLLAELCEGSRKPIVVYPNSGESWNDELRQWAPAAGPVDLVHTARTWVEMGARGVGGCCRVGPEKIRELAAVFKS